MRQKRERKISRRDFLWGGLIAGLSAVHLNPAIGSARTDLQPALPPKAAARLAVEGQPSATALGAAMHRAAHQLLDVPKILDDPLALRIIGAPAAAALREKLWWYRMNRSLRAFIVLRSRYAEDELSRAMDRGIGQYVILGAGLDTFAYRNPHPASRLRVFEVDHPATQSWKRTRLREEGIAVPASMAFAPVDFERQTLADGLISAGFRPEAPAFFSMLGVVMYLTKTAALDTFRYIASLPEGSEILFDYSLLPSLLGESRRMVHEMRAKRVAALGEPWITFFEPSSLAAEMRALGFTHVEDLGDEAAHDRYFRNREDSLRISGSGRIMKARV